LPTDQATTGDTSGRPAGQPPTIPRSTIGAGVDLAPLA
jgi:hypothetical protein